MSTSPISSTQTFQPGMTYTFRTGSPSSPQEELMRLSSSSPSSPETFSVVQSTPKKRRKAMTGTPPEGPLSPLAQTPKRNRNCSAKCSNCAAEQTPLWRKGADGKTLCNKCGLYWSRHNKHRPVKLDRSQMQALAAHNAQVAAAQLASPRKQTTSNVALKPKKTESNLKRSIDNGSEDVITSAKKRKIQDPTKKKTRKQQTAERVLESGVVPSIMEVHDQTQLSNDQFEQERSVHPQVESSVQESVNFNSTGIMSQQTQPQFSTHPYAGHSSENEVNVAVEQPTSTSTHTYPSQSTTSEDDSEFTIHHTTTDPFMMQIYSNNNVDNNYFTSYVQTPITSMLSAPSQGIVKPTATYLRAPQLQHLQIPTNYNKSGAFNDNTDIHSPCGDNLDSLFSSLFGNEAAPSRNTPGVSCDPFSVEESCDSMENNNDFLGSPFL